MADLDELAEDTAAVLLTSIKKAAEGEKQARDLLRLAHAYALVVDPGSAPASELDEE